MLVEGLKGADEDPTVLQDAPHPEVDVLQHLTALPHRLEPQTHYLEIIISNRLKQQKLKS